MLSKTKLLGQYPTPGWVAEALFERHFADLGSHDRVIEPACGPGDFLGVIPAEVRAVGVEIDPEVADRARRRTGREVITGDFCTVALPIEPTVILGNPPFKLSLIDRFLERAYQILPEGGRVGFLLPAYAFQTAARVAGYAQRWSIFQEMIPRNIYEGLKLPLVFALFGKDRVRKLIGFALYQEAADVQQFPQTYRQLLSTGTGPVWLRVVEHALDRLGGEAELGRIYAELEKNCPTDTRWWKEKVRQTLRRYAARFTVTGKGRYALNRGPSRGTDEASAQLALAY
ncbi:class I SAM-dependent methyltransferase [Ralstonia pseudosolanacearum]|uniref:class I SAM-dependent methyltransferase n=1 Tax=Ralstonia pseudosolanacearum TaxID=1310165 RepID=UPI003CE9BF02